MDLGTTFTTAAVERGGHVEMATLGDRSAAVPSVVLVREDGEALSGDAADRRAATEPDRVAREVKRRLGDPTPLILGGSPHAAAELMGMQLRDVVRLVAEREGGMPEMVTLTHPANWGPYKKELFDHVPRAAGLRAVRMITEPEAAAAHYASNERLEEGALVAVYDLGGGTFDATVLRTTSDGFEILGTPEGIEGLGGIDFDEAVFAHVDRALDGAVTALDPSDPRATSAVIRLRQDCVRAKEALSADTEVTIPVMLPQLQTEVRLTRGEFEGLVRPPINATIASLRRALLSAGVVPAHLSTVLLVGGSSRIPLVSRMVSGELGRPTAVDAHPKHAIVLGAAAMAGREMTSAERVAAGPPSGVLPVTRGPGGGNGRTPVPAPVPIPAQAQAQAHAPAPAPAPAPMPVPDRAPAPEPPRRPAAAGTTLPAPALAASGTPAAGVPAPSLNGDPGPKSGRGEQEHALRQDSGQRTDRGTNPGPQPERDPGTAQRKRRVPLVVAAGVLVAGLAGGGVLAYSSTSQPAPAAPVSTNQSPVGAVVDDKPAAPANGGGSGGWAPSGNSGGGGGGGTGGSGDNSGGGWKEAPKKEEAPKPAWPESKKNEPPKDEGWKEGGSGGNGSGGGY